MTTQLVLAALGGIAAIVLLIVWLKVHPFLSLMAGAGVMAIAAGVPYTDLFASFTTGLGSTVAGVGLLIVLGSIVGTLLISSGGRVLGVSAVDETPRLSRQRAYAALGKGNVARTFDGDP